jgi:hypothetical protein
MGFGYAVADRITGPYQVITKEKPLFDGYNASLIVEGDSVYVYFDLDGIFYYTTLNAGKAAIHHAPIEMLGASTLKDKYKFLDAPFVFKSGSYYFLLLTQFYAGYIERIRYMVADTPVGPWRFVQEEPLYTFLEAEASEQLQMPYPKPNAFAPPTQVIFSHSVFKDRNGNLFMAYHSSEKYAEPFLCIEPIEIKDSEIIIPLAKAKTQYIK